MKTQYKINILVITALLCLAQVFTFAQQADIILSEPLTKNVDLSASNSIVLAPGFHTNGYTFTADIVLHTIFTEAYSAPTLSNKNNIHTKSYTYPSSEGTGQPTNVGDILHNIQYFDGLGRLSQTIDYKASPQGNDMVKYYKYDEYGRQSQDFLPFTYPNVALPDISGHDQGEYIDASHITGSNNFLDTYYNQGNNGSGIPDANGEYYFSEMVFENSPLNRVLEQGAPGSSWAVLKDAQGNSTSNGHTIKIAHSTNSHSTEVEKFIVNTSGAVVSDGHYGINELYLTITKDENWTTSHGNNHTVHEYKDKQGRIVLKRAYESDNAHDTYYVYDDFGLLRCVIPPKAEGAVVNDLCYFYNYDERKRMIEKKIPGSDIVYMVYDKRDRLALTQDGNQRPNSKWTVFKYDALNRPVVTAEKVISYTLGELRTAFATHAYTPYETRTSTGNIGYTVNNHPYSSNITISESDILTITYYDDYSFTSVYSFNDAVNISGYSDSKGDSRYFDNVKGLETGSKTKLISGPTQGEWLINTIYYDDQYLPIQTSQTKFYSTFPDGSIEHTCIERTSSKYDFTGKAEQNRVTQWIGGQTTTIDKFYTYDHAGRLAKTEQEIEGDANGRIVLSSNIYSELSEVITKKLHSEDDGSSFAQNIDYQYNIRGWLENINDPHNIGSDLFAMELFYDEVNDLGSLTKSPQYNGNISGTIWKTHNKLDGVVSTKKAAYSYAYDYLNRLKDSYYAEGETLTSSNKYREYGLSYDYNGNIKSLKRTNSSGTLIDDLGYNYETSTSNRLLGITENSTTAEGLLNASSYIYDANGNFKTGLRDGHLYDITYNYLNLPSEVNLTDEMITTYAYDANGSKTMRIFDNIPENTSDTRYYAGAFEYNGGLNVSLIHMEEGVVNYASGGYTYEYHLKDHLGNVRLAFSPTSTGNDILQSNDYYAFGLRHLPVTPENDNKNLYNGKEIQEGTGWYDYGARMYDAAIGRWHTVDPLTEFASPYIYVGNNPINFIDPLGLSTSSYDPNKMNYKLNGYGIPDELAYTLIGESPSAPVYRDPNLYGYQNGFNGYRVEYSIGYSDKFGKYNELTERFDINEVSRVSVWIPYSTISSLNASWLFPAAEYDASSQGGDGLTWKTPVGAGMVLSGQPIWPKPGGVGGGGTAGKWTSPASKGLRALDRKVQSTLIKNKVLKQEVKFAANGLIHRYAGTRGIGAVAGRAVPYVGWGLVGWDVGWYLGQNYGISTWFAPKSPESKVLEYMRENGMLDD